MRSLPVAFLAREHTRYGKRCRAIENELDIVSHLTLTYA